MLCNSIIIASMLLYRLIWLSEAEKHSRAGNYLPFDYAYNILQSSEKDAIIFTMATMIHFLFGIYKMLLVLDRCSIVNLSLANTLWYIDQLKNREPWC
jgi:hypothetical protein